MAKKIYYVPIPRFSLTLRIDKTTIVNGNAIRTPGLSVEFGNHHAVVDDEDPKFPKDIHKLIEASDRFKSGFVGEVKGKPPPIQPGPGYSTGPVTSTQLRGARHKKENVKKASK